MTFIFNINQEHLMMHVWCKFGPAQICDKLSCGQGTSKFTDRRTDRQTQATTIPLRSERQEGKIKTDAM